MAESQRRFPPLWRADKFLGATVMPPGRQFAYINSAPKRNRERPLRWSFRLTSVVYHPPCASRTRPRYALVHHGKAARIRSRLPHRSARPVREQRSQASPVRSSRQNTSSHARFQGGGKTYGLCRAIARSIDLRTSEARACRWTPACKAIQPKKITLGVHDTINPTKKP
jgi:hypothetical protein